MDQRVINDKTAEILAFCLLLLLPIVVMAAGCSRSPEAEARREMFRGDDLLRQDEAQLGLQDNTDRDWSKMTETNSDLFQEAIKHYDKAVKLAPELAEPYYHRGYALLIHGKLLGAVDDFSLAIKKKPDYAKAYLMRSRAYEGLGGQEKAKADHDKALELQPGID